MVPDGYVIDHIDGNQMNDVIENYQMITICENNIKGKKQTNTTRLIIKFRCGSCGCIFERNKNQTHLVKGGKSTYCSRSCAGLHYRSSDILSEYRH